MGRPKRRWRKLAKCQLEYVIKPRRARLWAKLEFTIKDSLEREWQCARFSGFCFAGTLDAEYVGADNQKHRPVMLHRAILGSLERLHRAY